MFAAILAASFAAIAAPPEGFVVAKVTKVTVSVSPAPPPPAPPGTKFQVIPANRMSVHAEGIVPSSGYRSPTLVPMAEGLRPSEDGYLELVFIAVRETRDGIVGPTPIVAENSWVYAPSRTRIVGVRVLGAGGSKAEARLPEARADEKGGE
jgi:hypothetical protein